MKKKDKEKNDLAKLAKLVNLTKKIKSDDVKIEPKGMIRGPNKWRSQSPKFTPKEKKDASQTVEAGGMQVDPSLKNAYDQWREDKIREQNERREMAVRRAKAKRAAYLAESSKRAAEEGTNTSRSGPADSTGAGGS